MSFAKAPSGREKVLVRQVPQVVTFYDWSPGLSIQSCNPLPGVGVRGTAIRTGAATRNVTGRMFHKDKTSPTKGEKCIISGIMQNRGDVTLGRDPFFMEFIDGEGQMSHKDAWRFGKDADLHMFGQISCRTPSSLSCIASSEEIFELPNTIDGHIKKTPRQKSPKSWHHFIVETEGHVTPGTQAPPTSPQPIKKQVRCQKQSRKKAKFDNMRKTHLACMKNGGSKVQKVASDASCLEGACRTVVDVFLPRLSLSSDTTTSTTDEHQYDLPNTQ